MIDIEILATTYANSNSPGSLEKFLKVVNALKVSGGTYKIPEESLDDIKRALDIKGKDVPGFPGDSDYDVMTDGQVILMTDSQSQQKDLKDGIISKANALHACIHSFISPFTFYGYKHDPVADGLYQEISEKTSGVFVSPTIYSYYLLGKFIAESASKPCGYKSGEEVTPTKKDGTYCTTVKVSVFAKLLKLAMESSSVVTITDPKGKDYTTKKPVGGLSAYSKGNNRAIP